MSGRRKVAVGALVAVPLLALGGACLVFYSQPTAPSEQAVLPRPASFDPPLRDLLEEAVARVESDPGNAESWGQLGMICHAHGLYQEARHAYRRAQELDASDSLWPHLLGPVCELLSLPDEAMRALSRSIEMEPYDSVSRCALARIHQRRGEDDKARELYVEAARINPRSVAARVGLGQLAARAGVLDMAERNLQLALESFPRCGPAHAALARIYQRRGETELAAFHRRWSLVSGSRIPVDDPYMKRVEELGVSYTSRLRRGQRAAREGRWREAVENLRAAVALRGDLVEPRYLLGISLLEAGEVDAGLNELEEVAALEGRKVDAWLRIARARADRGESAEAHEAIREAFRVEPGNADVLVARGEVFRRERKPDLALADYERAISLEPGHAGAWLAKGELLHVRKASREETFKDDGVLARETKRAEAALAAFERALELEVDLAEAYAGAGRVHMQLWEFSREDDRKRAHVEAAIRHFKRLVKYFPDRKSGHVALIRALHSAGRREETVAAIRRARERWPDEALFRRRKPPAGTGKQ